MRTFLGGVAGAATHALFAVTVWYLFWFLKGDQPQLNTGIGNLPLNAVLSIAYGAIHSALLHRKVRDPLTRWITAPFYGLFFCVVTSVTLLGLIAGWTTGATIWWEATGLARLLITTAWYGSWVFLFYSLWFAGLGYQTGAMPWWRWMRGKPQPRRPFNPRGSLLWIRHPVYLGFLGLIWFSPVMTADRAILVATWTVYVFIGSWLKDERLEHFIGEPYRVYQSQITGYPGMFVGPLGRRPLAASATSLMIPATFTCSAHRDR
jgi:hypothetical protein